MSDPFFSNRDIKFPPSTNSSNPNPVISAPSSIVVVGANGSGKSRLGSWLEFSGDQKERVHRIAAQRSIAFPYSSSPTSFENAKDAFHFAPRPIEWPNDVYEANKRSMRINSRYGESLNVETAFLNDIDKLMVLLFSESFNALLEHDEKWEESGIAPPRSSTIINQVKALWQTVLPHRRILIRSGEIKAIARTEGSSEYHARAMSDGERVIFYLIAQCLCANPDSIIVVDEPELHIHKSIQDKLWNAIENSRPDCTFIYLTHDLAFAADRINSTKICLRAYSGNNFDWFKVDDNGDIPEEIYLEVLGSRKPVLFVEGSASSLDFSLYQAAYPNHTVKPVGGCSSVISATKSFRLQQGLHHIECHGLIDRDYLTSGQIQAYEQAGIHTINVAEVESLILVRPLIVHVAERLLLPPSDVLQQVEEWVFSIFNRHLHTHAIEVTKHMISLQLGRFSSSNDQAVDIDESLKNHMSDVSATTLYRDAKAEGQAIIETKDYDGALKLFNKKELSSGIGRFFNRTGKNSYEAIVKEIAKRDPAAIALALKNYLPTLA